MDCVVQVFTKSKTRETIKPPEGSVSGKFLIPGLDDELLDQHHVDKQTTSS